MRGLVNWSHRMYEYNKLRNNFSASINTLFFRGGWGGVYHIPIFFLIVRKTLRVAFRLGGGGHPLCNFRYRISKVACLTNDIWGKVIFCHNVLLKPSLTQSLILYNILVFI